MGKYVGIAAALALIAGVSRSNGVGELILPRADEHQADLVAIHTQYQRVSPYEPAASLKHLSFPCQATIAQGMTSVTMSEPRCVRVAEAKR